LIRRAALLVLLGGCASTTSTTGRGRDNAAPPASATSDDASFAREADKFYWAFFDSIPTGSWGGPIGVSLGYHQYDGKLPDLTAAGLGQKGDLLHRGKLTFDHLQPAALSPEHRLERDALLRLIRSQLFDLEVRRLPFRNPMWYTASLDLLDYVSRDYAPAAERAKAVDHVAEGAHAVLAAARANLEAQLPRPYLETALIQVNGQLSFVKKDVPAAFAQLGGADKAQLAGALDKLAGELAGWRDFLEAKKAQATDEYAIGTENFLHMLSEQEGIDVDLETLERAGKADLERNLKALTEVARQIDPKASVAQVMHRLHEEKPAAAEVNPLATRQMVELRKFVEDHKIATIPSPELATVMDSPPFMRVNTAFLRAAGVFEQKPLPSYYLISPPDPAWPPPMQKAYLPTREVLLFITAHEVWPGHFLHRLFRKGYPTRILKTMSSYSTSEGWAHYTEEMMWDEGAAGRDPKMHAAQIEEALLRDVRFLSAIGLHCKGMTVAESEKMFAEQSFADPKTAHQQAVRGTFDPGYLSYTLGKLMILKLRADWRRAHAGASLADFHDAFLKLGFTTVPAIRRLMLGEAGGPAL
jgi:uncharacterized protein (DUF885 family)